jgi:hypothetical protein
MGLQFQGNTGVIAEVDGTTFRAVRTTPRPVEFGALGSYRVGATSGTMAAALGANSEIFQFRWPDATRLALVHRVTISAGVNVAATAAALLSFRLTAARSWTVAGSGGTRLTLTTNNGKLRTSMGTTLVNDAGIATTGALTAGTKTLDATDLSNVSYGIGTGALTASVALDIIPDTVLFSQDDTVGYPLVLALNEGFVIRSGLVGPLTMTWAFSVNVHWTEVTTY